MRTKIGPCCPPREAHGTRRNASLARGAGRGSPEQLSAAYPQGRFEGRGIVICAGGERYFTCAWVLIHILRRVHQTTLPIQVWHLGRREMSEEMRLLLAEEGVETIDAELVTASYPAQIAGGWPLKPYAISHSRFREVLYLDADTVPLVDPQIAFTWDAYRDTGLLLWPDVVDIKKTNPIWTRLDLEPIEQASVELGVMLADKSRVWDVLDLAVLMNEHWEEIYDVRYGDKDTFLVSARLLDKDFGLVGPRPFRFGWDIVQRNMSGEPFIHHRTGSKWQLNHDNRPVAEPALMPHCEAALEDLRRRWSGRVFHAPERSARARAEELRLVAVRRFRYEPAVGGARDMDLYPGARVGSHGPEHHWAVIEPDGALVLQLYSGRQLSAELTKSSDTTWEGRSTTPGFEVRLQDRAGLANAACTTEPPPRSAREARSRAARTPRCSQSAIRQAWQRNSNWPFCS